MFLLTIVIWNHLFWHLFSNVLFWRLLNISLWNWSKWKDRNPSLLVLTVVKWTGEFHLSKDKLDILTPLTTEIKKAQVVVSATAGATGTHKEVTFVVLDSHIFYLQSQRTENFIVNSGWRMNLKYGFQHWISITVLNYDVQDWVREGIPGIATCVHFHLVFLRIVYF